MIKEFNPDLLIISAGFDSAKGDPLGKFSISPAGFAYMTIGLKQLAKKSLVVLEGGYNLESIAVSSEAVTRALLGQELPFTEMNMDMSYEEMKNTLIPRDCIRSAISTTSKCIYKHWTFCENLIIEKRSRTNTMNSEKSGKSGKSGKDEEEDEEAY
jgi:hypothetical protein